MKLRVAYSGLALVVAAAVVLASRGFDPDRPVARCTGAGAIDFGCQERRYVSLTRAAGPGAALDDLGRRMKGSGFLRAACHQLVHRIGRTAGAKVGVAAFSKGDPLCASGYYHGVTEAAMDRLGSGRVVRDADTVCAPLRTVDRTNCIHGMGHGFMHVLERDLDASLEGCDALPASAERHGCYSGVFMENLAAADEPDRATLRPDEPLYPCTDVADRYKVECYDRQSTYALHVSNGDFDAVFRLCARTERAFRGACNRGLGGDVAAETKLITGRAQQARARRRLCLLGPSSRARSQCVAGATRVMLQNLDGGPAELDALCVSLEAVATQPQHAACLRAGQAAYGELLAQQTGETSGLNFRALGLDFVCHLKKPGRRGRSI